MDFLADENVWKLLVRALQARGHDVDRPGEDHRGVDDHDVLARASAESRILLTEDKDFGHLVFGLSRPAHGVVMVHFNRFRTAPEDTVREIVDAIERQGEDLVGSLTVIEPNRTRRRKL